MAYSPGVQLPPHLLQQQMQIRMHQQQAALNQPMQQSLIMQQAASGQRNQSAQAVQPDPQGRPSQYVAQPTWPQSQNSNQQSQSQAITPAHSLDRSRRRDSEMPPQRRANDETENIQVQQQTDASDPSPAFGLNSGLNSSLEGWSSESYTPGDAVAAAIHHNKSNSPNTENTKSGTILARPPVPITTQGDSVYQSAGYISDSSLPYSPSGHTLPTADVSTEQDYYPYQGRGRQSSDACYLGPCLSHTSSLHVLDESSTYHPPYRLNSAQEAILQYQGTEQEQTNAGGPVGTRERRSSTDPQSSSDPTAITTYGKQWEELRDAAAGATEDEDSGTLTGRERRPRLLKPSFSIVLDNEDISAAPPPKGQKRKSHTTREGAGTVHAFEGITSQATHPPNGPRNPRNIAPPSPPSMRRSLGAAKRQKTTHEGVKNITRPSQLASTTDTLSTPTFEMSNVDELLKAWTNVEV